MGLNHSPSIVTNSLLLNLDLKNLKKFGTTLGTNLIQDQNYNASTWGTYPTFKQTGIDAPDGSKNAVRMTSITRTCTYTLTSNVVTVTMPNHGLSSGWSHNFVFTSGTGVTGAYSITVVDVNTFTFTVTAANGSGNVTVYARTGIRVNFTAFTPNGTDTYTVSFWARLIRSTFLNAESAGCDLNDSTPSLNYTSLLVQNQWVQIVASGVATATAKSFFDILSDTFGDIVIDFWGLKLENQTANNTFTPLKDTVSGYTFSLIRPQYAALTDSTVTFTRTASAPKHGGLAYTTGTGSLTSGSFLYNDHTWEVWFRIDDVNPGGYGDATEARSCLLEYRGYHAGFEYNATNLFYSIWDSSGPTIKTCCSWTLGASGSQINQGSWYQLVVTRSGNIFTPYVNGVGLGTGSTQTFTSAYSGTSNDLHIGATANVAAGASSYVYYGKNTIANMKMYNRALSAAEVSQNFNALRGRFGL